jgi:hypothetical protein
MAVRTLQPHFYIVPPWLAWRIRPLLRSFGYRSEEKRDLRLDLLRGFCVFAMVVDHIGGASWLYALTGGNTWLISAAEGFVFLSGLTMGMVYAKKIVRNGLRACTWAMLHRAGTLYGLTVALTLLFAFLERYTTIHLWTDRSYGLGVDTLPQLIVGALTLHFSYHGTDILVMYTMLVAAAPAVFFLLSEGKTVHVLAASWGIWALNALFPEQATLTWDVVNSAYFPLSAWQVLFVSGLVLGYHREAIAERLSWLRKGLVGGLETLDAAARVMAAPIAALVVVTISRTTGLAAALGTVYLEGSLQAELFTKPGLGPGRLVLFFLAIALAYAVLTLFWKPVQRALGWFLIPLGQNALYGYTMQFGAILTLYNLFTAFGVGSDDPSFKLVNSLAQLGSVLVIWLMVRRHVLFNLVPR